MADGLNKVMIMGNLGADPELRVTQGGDSVLTLNVAINESYLDRNRVRQETVEWVRCVLWGKRAEALAKFLRKGAQVFVEGSIKTNSYEDREGIKRYSTQVRVANIIVGGSNRPRNQPDDPERRRPNRRDHHEDPPGGGGAGAGGYDNGGFDGADYGAPGGGDDDSIPF
jgi:single-strand DNA-binding protein